MNTNTDIAHHHTATAPHFSLKLSSYKVTLALFGLLFLGVVMPAKALEFNEGANPGNTVLTVGDVSTITLGNATGNEFYTLLINGYLEVPGRELIPGLTYYSASRNGRVPARISGTPTALRESVIKYRAGVWDENAGKFNYVEFEFLLVVVAPIPTFQEDANPGDTVLTVGDVSTVTLGSASRNPDYVLSINGANAVGGGELVPGLTYHSQSGANPATISGTPTAVGAHVITYTASIHYDSENINAIEFEFALSIVAAVPVFHEGANPGDTTFTVGDASSVTLGSATRNPFYDFFRNGYKRTSGQVISGLTYRTARQAGTIPATLGGTPTMVGEWVIKYRAGIWDESTKKFNYAEFQFTLSIVPAVPEFPEGANPGDTEFFVGRYSSVTLGSATRNPFYRFYRNGYQRPGGVQVIPGLTYRSARQAGTIPATLSGTPTLVGTHVIRYSAGLFDEDDNLHAADFQFTLSIVLPPPSFPNGANPGDQSLVIDDVAAITLGNGVGGEGTLNYALTSAGSTIATGDAIVAGLIYTAAGGGNAARISGTPTATATQAAFTYIVTESAATAESAAFIFNLEVLPRPTFATQQTDLEFTAGHARTFTLATASGGSGALAYTLARQTGTLRTQALAFASSRVLRSTASLTTSDAGDYILTATDTNNVKAHTTFNIAVANQLRFASGANPGDRGVLTTTASTITLGDAEGGKAKVAYVLSVGGTAVTDGNEVLAGMTYTARSGSPAATISGTPTALNSGVDVTYIATDANNASVTFGFTLSVVKPNFPANFAATYTRNHPIYSNADGVSASGDALTLPAAASSGTPNYTAIGNLPNGLSATDLGDGRQIISGSPTQDGVFSYMRIATDANGADTFTLTLHIAAVIAFATAQPQVHFTAANADTARLLTASGGTGDLVYSLTRISGAVPAGLTINAASAELGATSAIAASDSGRYIMTATDTLGATMLSLIRMQIAGELGIDVTGGMIDDLTYIVGAALQLPAADGGYNPMYSVSGLGAGLTFDASRRAIDGVLTIATAADLELPLTYAIEDANGAMTSDAFTLHIIPLRFATAQRTLRLQTGQTKSYNLADALTVADGAGGVAYAITPDPSALTGLTYDNTHNPQLIATEAFAVDDNAVLTYTLTATYSVGAQNRIASQSIVLDVQLSGEQLSDVIEEVISKLASTVVGETLSAITERLASAGGSAVPLASIGGQTPQMALASYAKAMADGGDDNNALLANSRFVLPFASLPSHSNVGAVWGSTQMRELDGDADAVDWSGEVSGFHLGVDFKIGDNLIGVAVSQNDTNIDYKTTDAQGGIEQGKYEISLTALHPYINRKYGEVDYWASIGLGEGEMSITEQGGDAIKSDISLSAIGGGAGVQLEPGLQLRVEVQTADIDIEGNTSSGLLQQDLSTNSIRALARWQNLYLTPTIPLFVDNQTAFFEAGMRRDSGDGESRRAAMEAALGWNYRGQRATIEAAAHGLFGRKDYREWGAYTNVRVSGGDDGQGLSLRVRPSYGEAQGEFGRVWNADSFDDIVADDSNNDSTAYQWRTETRLSYGIQSASGLVAPFVDAAADTYRLGVDWSPHRYFDVNVTGERRHGNDDANERRVLLQGEVKF